MTESIGNVYETKVPALSDIADIQEALRIYHYGAPSGSNTEAGEYPITNSEPDNLVIPSMAHHLYDLQTQIDNFQTGILPTAYVSKGVLISASSQGTPLALEIPTTNANGQVLTINTSRNTGLEWSVPAVTLTNTVTLINKTLTNSTISSGGLIFAGPTGNSFTTTLILPTPTANKTVLFPATADIPATSTTLVGRDTVDTLTNKSMSVGQLTGTLPISSGGTGATTAANARSSLEIFNTQVAVTSGDDRTQYSGKIYVANPAIVGASGASLDGAANGDLWFW
jgi:hypothetical protein